MEIAIKCIEKFDVNSDQYLDLSNLHLTELPDHPKLQLVKKLNCGFNDLTSLPSLASSLQELCCYHNQLTSLSCVRGTQPALPRSLKLLNCSDNLLISLSWTEDSVLKTPMLPSSLQTLYCYHNQLTSLPMLPSSLRGLNCDQNQLISLPMIPLLLEWLSCDQNQLISLPILPSSLQILYCNQNHLPYNNLIEYRKWRKVMKPILLRRLQLWWRKMNIKFKVRKKMYINAEIYCRPQTGQNWQEYLNLYDEFETRELK